MKSKFREDLEGLLEYVMFREWEDFLESLQDNGSPALTEEELERLIDDKSDAYQLFARAWQHPEEDHVFAVARRLEEALNKHKSLLDTIPD